MVEKDVILTVFFPLHFFCGLDDKFRKSNFHVNFEFDIILKVYIIMYYAEHVK